MTYFTPNISMTTCSNKAVLSWDPHSLEAWLVDFWFVSGTTGGDTGPLVCDLKDIWLMYIIHADASKLVTTLPNFTTTLSFDDKQF